MTDNLPARQPIERSAPMKVTGRLKHCLELMVWQGLSRSQAAEQAGLREHSLYCALRKAHVRTALLREMEVLRTSERPRNILALVNVRDTGRNEMARVNAAKALEQLSEESVARSSSVPVSPGLVIQVIDGPAPTPADPRDVTPRQPLIEHEAPRTDIKHDFIPISEVEREPVPITDPIPIEEPPPAERSETLAELQDRLAAYSARHAAPPGLAACPPQPWESNYKPEQPRRGPRASRFRARRGD
jgi:hypothetical protein